jgi:hypothetical protein
MLSHALSIFFIKLAVGILPGLALIRIQDTGKTFFRLLIFLSFFAALLGLLLHFSRENWVLISFVCTMFVLFFSLARFNFEKMNFSILLVFVLGVITIFVQGFESSQVSGLHISFNLILGSLLMGSALLSMILGHWYLIRPRLSFHYLKRSILIFFALLIFRLAFILCTLFSQPEGLKLLIHRVGDILFYTRFLWGGMLPLFFLFFAYQCAQVHSNRSATGILYFTTGSIFMGELMADYLSFMSGIPI